MESIHIPRLTKLPQQKEEVQIHETLPNLETLTPVKGWIRVQHRGNFLEVEAKLDTIVTLSCDRCLQQYNHRLSIHPSEIIWLDESADEVDPVLLDRDLSPEDLVETLSPQGYFEPDVWIYEQLCLELPQRKLCDPQCEGIELPSTQAPATVDHRWSGLEALKDQFFNQN